MSVNIKDYVLDEKAYIVGLRRYFHMYPELSGQEYNTAKKIEQELDSMHIQHKRVADTGVAAFIYGKDGLNPEYKNKVKTVVLRADIDALRIQEKNDTEYKSRNDGVMHACGHDAHTAALLGAAKILNRNKDELKGNVVLIFQQAEEIGAGALHFIKEGYLDNAYRVLGIHMASFLPVKQVSIKEGECAASCDYFKIKVKGKSAHVSKPDDGIDALYIASQIVVSLQAVAARLTNPLDPVIVGIGKMTAGTNYNIIANEAVLEGTTRAFNASVRNRINNAVTDIAKQTARAFGTEAYVEFKNYASPLVNDKTSAKELAPVASEILGKENVILDSDRILMADDFAEYLLKTKGVYAYVGSNGGSKSAYPHHNECFDIDEDAILVATNLYVDYTKKILENE